jgi:hypothetical protein
MQFSLQHPVTAAHFNRNVLLSTLFSNTLINKRRSFTSKLNKGQISWVVDEVRKAVEMEYELREIYVLYEYEWNDTIV